ncbi:hypothetical protein MKW94_017826 [Papaver nudicaule]|uniref:TPD1 protein homolog 1-like n=1 Tax=Papaver nudicaule TaxID=74823 RepID=A0AA41VNM5_PAPNU|nr:hypothetical protein [Papaver nudicaule]
MGCPIQILLLLALVVCNTSNLVLGQKHVGGEGLQLSSCPYETIQITQSSVDPLPGGLPQHLVVICNICSTNCIVSHVHLSCGAFSSAQLIPPNDFRRVRYNDCLVNGGRQMIPGDCISFNYAESFPYPLAVSSVECKSNPRGLKHHH